MKKYIFILTIMITGLLMIPGAALSDSPEFMRVNQALSSSSGGSHGMGVAIDPTNNDIIVTGYFSGTSIFSGAKLSSPNNNDMFVARYNSNGKLLWIKDAGGSGTDKSYSYGIAADNSGNSIIAGMFSGQAFGLTNTGETNIAVVKFDPDGNILWTKNTDYVTAYTNDVRKKFDLSVDTVGDIYVTGYQQLDPNNGLFDVFVSKLSGTDGTILWHKTEGGASEDFGNGIATNGTGVVVTGSFNGSATFGSTTLTGYGNDDIFLGCYAADGTPNWAVQAGGAGDDAGNAVTTDASGNIYVTGLFSGVAQFDTTSLESTGSSDIFVAGYNSSGELLFAVRAGGLGDDSGKGISMDASGNIMVTGEFSGTATFGSFTLQSAGDTDVFFATYDTSGNCLSAVSAGGLQADSGTGIAAVDGNIVVTGSFQDIAGFGEQSIATYADSDMFLSIYGVPSFSQDFSGNGKLGLEDAIGILQILTKLRQ